jgi:pimeloyl-ACP methyl ester carboxylesterase
MHAWLAVAALVFQTQDPTIITTRQLAIAPAETLSVTTQGTGQPVVIIPGLLGAAYGFRHVTDGLARAGYGVVIVDPLGTGASGRPDDDIDWSLLTQADRIAAVLDSIGVRDALILVHALGAPIGFRLAYRRPDLVSGVVSINGGPSERLDTPGVKSALRLAPVLRLFGMEGRARGKVRDGLLEASGDRTWVTDQIVEIYGAPYRQDLWGTLEMLRDMSEAKELEPLYPNLPRIDAPIVLLVGGARSAKTMEPEDMTSLLTQVRDLRVDTIAGAGNYIHEEQPSAVIAAVRRMAAELAQSLAARQR